jgi:hypothetical protein
MFLSVWVSAVIFRRQRWRDSLEIYRFIDLYLPLQMSASYIAFAYSARSHSYIKLLVNFRFSLLLIERKKLNLIAKRVRYWALFWSHSMSLTWSDPLLLKKFNIISSCTSQPQGNTILKYLVCFPFLQADDILIMSPHFCLCQLTAFIVFTLFIPYICREITHDITVSDQLNAQSLVIQTYVLLPHASALQRHPEAAHQFKSYLPVDPSRYNAETCWSRI